TTPSTWSPTPATRRPRTTSPAASADPPQPERAHRPGCGRRIRPRSDAGPAISILRPKRSGWGRSEPEGMFRTSAPTAPPTPPTAATASAPGGRPAVPVAPPLPARPRAPRPAAGPPISILSPTRSGWGRSAPARMFRTSAPTAPPTPPTAATASAPGGRPDVAVAPVLRARRLVKTYGEQSTATRALDGVDLDIARADSLAIMGPSGCGKTTLLHVLAGILQPSSGAVDLNGTDLATLSARRRTRLRREDFGFVFQDGQLLPELTALENVLLPRMLAGTSRRQAAADA